MCFSFTKITTKKHSFLETRETGLTLQSPGQQGHLKLFQSQWEDESRQVNSVTHFPEKESAPQLYLLNLTLSHTHHPISWASVFTASHSQDNPRLLPAFPLSITVRYSDCRKQVSCYRKAVFPLPKKKQQTHNRKFSPKRCRFQSAWRMEVLLLHYYLKDFCSFSIIISLAITYSCVSIVCTSLSATLAICGKHPLTTQIQERAAF